MSALSRQKCRKGLGHIGASQPGALGSLASLLDRNKDGQVLDDIIGMASRYN